MILVVLDPVWNQNAQLGDIFGGSVTSVIVSVASVVMCVARTVVCMASGAVSAGSMIMRVVCMMVGVAIVTVSMASIVMLMRDGSARRADGLSIDEDYAPSTLWAACGMLSTTTLLAHLSPPDPGSA